jgi:hypothetical protein
MAKLKKNHIGQVDKRFQKSGQTLHSWQKEGLFSQRFALSGTQITSSHPILHDTAPLEA